jgi:hypothetical protein
MTSGQERKNFMFVDAKKYKHHDKLVEMADALKLDYDEFIVDHPDPRKHICVFQFEYPEITNGRELEYKDDWWAVPIFIDGQIDNKMYPNHWLRTKEIARTLPGIYQQIINFIRPNGGKLPWHNDFGSWDRISQHFPNPRGYTAAIGIDMLEPRDKLKQGIRFDRDVRSYGNKEIIAFDGKNYMHTVWNLCDAWRVSSVIDIADTEWENVVG